MGYVIEVENIKCGGCANSISKRLTTHQQVDRVEVDIDNGRVRIDGDEASRPDIVGMLAQMGYPETGSLEGIKSAAAKAKSFVSCAVGRLDGTE